MNPLPIDIISGFLGSGKTTFIRRLLEGPYKGKGIAVIENDFGEVGIDGKLLEAAGSRVTEIVSGCICCTLALDFQQAIETLASDPDIERIVIEPSGVAKLTDVLRAVARVSPDTVRLGRGITVVDVNTYRSYSEGFGAFYLDQVMNADVLLVSKLEAAAGAESADEITRLLQERNPRAEIVAVSWDSDRFADFLAGFSNGKPGAGERGVKTPIMQEVSGAENAFPNAGEFRSAVIAVPPGITLDQIKRLIDRLEAENESGSHMRLARIKGLIETADDGAVKVDWSGGGVTLEPVEKIAPDNRLVVIGVGLPPQAELKEILNDLLC
ncbi:MAG: CobW family GTP-binding protein [Spirochaetia bacterium]